PRHDCHIARNRTSPNPVNPSRRQRYSVCAHQSGTEYSGGRGTPFGTAALIVVLVLAHAPLATPQEITGTITGRGQSDPGISSLYDFPQNDPTYASIGVPQFGFQGDIQFLGDPNGILPLDRPHQLKLVGNYMFHALNLGVGINAVSGAPLTPPTTNPQYGNGGEIPTAARGSGIQTVDGLMTRTPFQSDVDFQVAYQ